MYPECVSFWDHIACSPGGNGGGHPLLNKKDFLSRRLLPGRQFFPGTSLSFQPSAVKDKKCAYVANQVHRAAMRRGNSDQFNAVDAEPAHRPRRAVVREGVRVRIRRWFIPVVGTIAIVLALRNYTALAAWTEEVRLWEDQVCTRALSLAQQEAGVPRPLL